MEFIIKLWVLLLMDRKQIIQYLKDNIYTKEALIKKYPDRFSKEENFSFLLPMYKQLDEMDCKYFYFFGRAIDIYIEKLENNFNFYKDDFEFFIFLLSLIFEQSKSGKIVLNDLIASLNKYGLR